MAAIASNIINFAEYRGEAFYNETGLPPEYAALSSSDLQLAMSELTLGADVGSIIRAHNLPVDAMLTVLMAEAVAIALERVPDVTAARVLIEETFTATVNSLCT